MQRIFPTLSLLSAVLSLTACASRESEPVEPTASDAGADASMDIAADAPGDTGGPVDVAVDGSTPSDWPSGANESLPHANLFYGNPYHGETTGNTKLFRYEASRRFRAERTGKVKAFRYNNRTLTAANIADRCVDGTPSVWCDCRTGKLDEYTCGWHIGNSYSLGNGGALLYEIRGDDGTPAHQPSPEVLGRTTTPFVPVEHATEQYPTLEFDKPIDLVAGRIYHLVFQQTNPPTKCGEKLGGLSVVDAAKCDRDKGLVGLNGAFTHKPPPRHGGPVFGTAGAMLMRDSADQKAWDVSSQSSKPWYELRYDDGVWVGDALVTFGFGAHSREFGAADQVREVFKVSAVTRRATGLWLRVARFSGESGLTVQLREDAVTTPLFAVTLDPKAVRLATWDAKTDPEELFRANVVDWVYVPFDKVIALELGRTYSVALSSSSSRFLAATSFPLDYKPYLSLSRNVFSDGHAELSADGGKTFESFTTYRGRDLQLVFTLEGMPTEMP